MLSAEPPRFFNDIGFAEALGLERTGDDLTFWQYYPAVMRAVELLRPGGRRPRAAVPPSTKRFDSPVGRYVHVDLDGHDHRIYFEEAGTGIPLLMQHTAGSHGVQWRHLFEDERITDHFRLIAYDLPFHGKSVPPTGKAWWTERYRLTQRHRHEPGRHDGERARARPSGVHGLLGRRTARPRPRPLPPRRVPRRHRARAGAQGRRRHRHACTGSGTRR